MTSRLLDCDHVFDALTRGPFSGNGPDGALVDEHLHSCPDCRRLAEALRPAVDLFHEALQDDDLPSYEGGLPPAHEDSVANIMVQVRQAQPPASDVLTVTRRPQPSQRRIDPLSIAVAAIVGLILGVLLAAPGETFEKPRLESQATAATLDSHGQQLLEDLQLVTACRTTSSTASPLAAPTTTAPVGHYACCTRCHKVDATHGGLFKHRHSLTRLLQGCQACHKSA